MKSEKCLICGCSINREKYVYAKDNIKGRSHLTKHHLVATRFLGKGKRKPIFKNDPWSLDKDKQELLFCYECHEELLHNPVLLPKDIEQFAELVKRKKLNEREKPDNKSKIAGRIKLFHQVIKTGINTILEESM